MKSFISLNTETELLNFRGSWNKLWLNLNRPTIFNSFEWNWNWWQIYKPYLGGNFKVANLKILLAADTTTKSCKSQNQEPTLVETKPNLPIWILPMYEVNGLTSSKIVGLLGAGDPNNATVYTEYNDLVSDSKEFMVSNLSELFSQYSIINLGLHKDQSKILELQNQLGFKSYSSKSSFLTSYEADLRGGFKSYLAKLSSNSRWQVNRLLKEFDRQNGKVELSENSFQTKSWFKELVKDHQKDWQQRGFLGAFNDSRVTRFHENLIDTSPCPVVARISINNKPISHIYGFMVANRFEWYQMGVCNNNYKRVGITSIVSLIRSLSESDCNEFDFLAGNNQLKEQLSTSNFRACSLQLYKNSFNRKVFNFCKKLPKLVFN